jgi:hypothetical protein
VNLLLALRRHPEPEDHEERTEDVDDPVEPLDEHGAHDDHRAALDESAEDAPEQHAVLVERRDLEVREDQEEHEQVVDAERFLHEIAGGELERGWRP